MSEATGDPSVQTAAPTAPPTAPTPEAAATEASAPREKRPLSVRTLLEAGAHFGHQTRRWDPKMKPYIFGERDGIHIVDLDRTLPLFEEALAFLRETVAQGGKALFVGTKRQAQAPIKREAERSGQFYVNNRWLGGMLTNWRTVKKSLERFKEQLAIVEDEEKSGELTKKELSWLNRSITKYRKSLDGIKEMTRLPDVLFIIDLKMEHIAVSEARRLGIPVIAIVDTNCSPDEVDFPIPANDDAIRAIELYCELAGDACLEGAELFNERVQSEVRERPSEEPAAAALGRRVVEIRQPTARRGRQPGGAHSAGARRRPGPPEEPAPTEPTAEATAEPASRAKTEPSASAKPERVEAEKSAESSEAASESSE